MLVLTILEATYCQLLDHLLIRFVPIRMSMEKEIDRLNWKTENGSWGDLVA